MNEFKITYNYIIGDYMRNPNWLIGCKIISAETYIGAQEKFKKECPELTIRNIEQMFED